MARRFRRRWRVAMLGGLAAALLLAAAFAGPTLVVAAPVEEPDAIVSLASHEWERLPATATLALKYPRAHVVLTLPPIVTRHRCHGCAHRVDYLVGLGVDRQRIDVVPLAESSTRGEARAVRAIVRRHDLRKVLVVTSAYHTRRALRTFRNDLEPSGVTIGIHPAGVGEYASPSRWWTRPYDRWYVSYEWAALTRDAVRQMVEW